MVTPDTSDTPDTLCVSLIHLIQKALPWIIVHFGSPINLLGILLSIYKTERSVTEIVTHIITSRPSGLET